MQGCAEILGCFNDVMNLIDAQRYAYHAVGGHGNSNTFVKTLLQLCGLPSDPPFGENNFFNGFEDWVVPSWEMDLFPPPEPEYLYPPDFFAP